MPETHAIASGTRRPLYVAVHEAGHVAAEWLLGGLAHAVHIPTGGRLPQDRKVRDVHADGYCEGTFNYTRYDLLHGVPTHVLARQTDPEMLRNTRRYGLACAVVALAGGYAEALGTQIGLVRFQRTAARIFAISSQPIAPATAPASMSGAPCTILSLQRCEGNSADRPE
jgi:hypothetical protein